MTRPPPISKGKAAARLNPAGDASGSRGAQRLRLRVDLARSGVEVLEERGAKPAADAERGGKIPVAAAPPLPPLQLCRVAGEGARGEYEAEPPFRARDGPGQPLDHLVDAEDERLPPQAGLVVVEHPGALVLVGTQDEQGVSAHFFPRPRHSTIRGGPGGPSSIPSLQALPQALDLQNQLPREPELLLLEVDQILHALLRIGRPCGQGPLPFRRLVPQPLQLPDQLPREPKLLLLGPYRLPDGLFRILGSPHRALPPLLRLGLKARPLAGPNHHPDQVGRGHDERNPDDQP